MKLGESLVLFVMFYTNASGLQSMGMEMIYYRFIGA